MNDKTPINKGNYDMETAERNALFEKYRGEGREQEYRDYRNKWVTYAKEQYVSEWPLLVDIELSSVCNLKCPMCYTITEEFKSKINARLMDASLYYSIIDEIAEHVPAIRLSLRGEPTLHPQFVDFIKYAKQKGIMEVSFLTNGSKLTDSFIKQIIIAGADWVTVSVDGMAEEYNAIRKPITFHEIYHRLKRFHDIKQELGTHRPVVKIQGIWPAVRPNAEEYYNTFSPIVDQIAFNPLIDYLDKDEQILYEKEFCCPQHYQRIIIASDGQALMCSNDEDNMQVIGNRNTETIYEIWHGDKLNEIRMLHQKGKFLEIPVCRKCYLPRATDENEKAYVNGREIIIKNYVGRSQIIGE